jgi:NAD+ synthase (glutamine-hydrolysing)
MVRIALGQINTTVGDLEGNVDRMVAAAFEATGAGADLVCFPELAVTGYPPEDLVLRPEFVRDNLEALEELARRTAAGSAVLVGFVDRSPRGLHNAAALLHWGEVLARYRKVKLPNYGVFDEQRYFVPGDAACPIRLASSALGISVCEDAWQPGRPWGAYAREGSSVIPNINASPYHRGKILERLEVCRDRAAETGAWIVYVNAVGGQDELVFDGGSMVVSPDGELAWHGAMFDEDMLVVDVDVPEAPAGYPGPDVPGLAKGVLPDPSRPPWPEGAEEVYRALVLGLGDYVRKNGFREVVVGLSGGVDSALVATLAADALGPEAVRAVAMPSPYSSPESLEDAAECSRRLGIRLDEIPIDDVFKSYLSALDQVFAGTEENVAEENLQARIRGNVLMAMSNKFGSLVLATGNKSEMAAGYSTLYGDLAGGFAPIKDVPKTLVYQVVAWRNAQGSVAAIPERIVTKAPTAELRPNQKDSDTLPPYDELDPVLERYVERDMGPEEIIAEGFDPDLVRRVVGLVDRAEYKRRQAPPGVKITPKAFGRDRRLPITNGYRRNRPPMGQEGPTSTRAG